MDDYNGLDMHATSKATASWGPPPLARVAAMRTFISHRAYMGCANVHIDDESEATQLLGDCRFHALASLGDDQGNAFNMISILLWLNGGDNHVSDNAFWDYMARSAFSPSLAPLHSIEVMVTNVWTVGSFIDREFKIIMDHGGPIPVLENYKTAVLERFKIIIRTLQGV